MPAAASPIPVTAGGGGGFPLDFQEEGETYGSGVELSEDRSWPWSVGTHTAYLAYMQVSYSLT